MTQHKAKKKLTQYDEIMFWMMDGNRVTQLPVIRQFNCTRLAARIYDIEREYQVRAMRRDVRCPVSQKIVSEYWLSRAQISHLRELKSQKAAA